MSRRILMAGATVLVARIFDDRPPPERSCRKIDSAQTAMVEKARQTARKAAGLDNLQTLLEVGLDGVVIATPSALHADQTAAALAWCRRLLVRAIGQTDYRRVLAGPPYAHRTNPLEEVVAANFQKVKA